LLHGEKKYILGLYTKSCNTNLILVIKYRGIRWVVLWKIGKGIEDFDLKF
jgi:hypothetical protein